MHFGILIRDEGWESARKLKLWTSYASLYSCYNFCHPPLLDYDKNDRI